jgi:hypothetical protein
MKIAEVSNRRRRSSTLRERVLQHLEARSDEVFSYRDDALAKAVGAKVSAVSFTLWALHRDGLIAKEEANGKVFFGSRRAIDQLREQLGLQPVDPFERARANRARISRRVGSIDVIELLDAVRGAAQ